MRVWAPNICHVCAQLRDCVSHPKWGEGPNKIHQKRCAQRIKNTFSSIKNKLFCTNSNMGQDKGKHKETTYFVDLLVVVVVVVVVVGSSSNSRSASG